MSLTCQIQEIRCKSVKRFLSKLSSTTDAKAPNFTNPWVYRGHADATWQLKPPAWRIDGRDKLKPLMDWLRPQITAAISKSPNWPILKADFRDNRLRYALHITSEVFAVTQFCAIADELGLVIPNA